MFARSKLQRGVFDSERSPTYNTRHGRYFGNEYYFGKERDDKREWVLVTATVYANREEFTEVLRTPDEENGLMMDGRAKLS